MSPLVTAEQAVLGAVLLDPGQLSHLDWLAPPVHRALFAALRTLRNDGHPALAEQPVPLSWVTDAVYEADLHIRGLTPAYAHTLIQSCPRPAHAPVYGRMVLEGAIHRTITEHAVRLHQTARADALRGDVEEALHHADVLTGVLDGLARRWGTEPRPVAPATEPVAPPVRADRVVEDERFLLTVLVEQPNAVDEVVGWLRPGDFADPAHGQLYRCLDALHHRGEPIDHITLLWEAQRRGLLANGTLSRDQLTAICNSGSSGSAEWLGERVVRSSVTRTAAPQHAPSAPWRRTRPWPPGSSSTTPCTRSTRSTTSVPAGTPRTALPPQRQQIRLRRRTGLPPRRCMPPSRAAPRAPPHCPRPGSALHLARPPCDRLLAAADSPFPPAHRSSSP